MDPADPIPRRDFTRAVALAAIAPAAVASAQEKAKEPEKKDDDKRRADAKPAPPDEVEARMAIILARYGKHAQLDEKARAAIKNDVAGIVRRGEALRKIPLGNGDGPFPIFHPYRGPLVP